MVFGLAFRYLAQVEWKVSIGTCLRKFYDFCIDHSVVISSLLLVITSGSVRGWHFKVSEP
jgi:hypothetical protein